MTGSALCLVHGHLRTLIAHLGAANIYSKEDLTSEDKRTIEKVHLVYIENFFFTHSPLVIWDVVRLCKIHGVAIIFNLSGAYLFNEHALHILPLVKCANVVIGNETEFLALSKSCSFENLEIAQIASAISEMGVQNPICMQQEKNKPLLLENLQLLEKIVVVTQGPKPVLCAYQGKFRFSMPTLQPKNVIDTTGAGDAFVAGFLKGLLDSLNMYDCIALGCYASTEIIQQVGCSLPLHNPMKIENIITMYPLDPK